MKSRFHPLPSRSAFTLIESLAVVAILAIIVAIATPAMLGAIKATRLTAAGELVTGKLAEAQNLALTFSSDVELRLYKAPQVQLFEGGSGQFLQIYQWVESDAETDPGTGDEPAAALKPVGDREQMPEGIIISYDAKFSSIWHLEPKVEETTGGDREYVAIRFRPDGSTDLLEAATWFMTLVDRESAAATDLPHNFYTVQIDPVTSKLEIYRPE